MRGYTVHNLTIGTLKITIFYQIEYDAAMPQTNQTQDTIYIAEIKVAALRSVPE